MRTTPFFSLTALSALATVLAACEEPVGIRPTPKPTDAAPAPGPLGTAMAVDDSRMIPGLSRPVDVVRDRYGIVHIYAFDAADAFRAQGFMAASDRGLARDAHARDAVDSEGGARLFTELAASESPQSGGGEGGDDHRD